MMARYAKQLHIFRQLMVEISVVQMMKLDPSSLPAPFAFLAAFHDDLVAEFFPTVGIDVSIVGLRKMLIMGFRLCVLAASLVWPRGDGLFTRLELSCRARVIGI